MRVTVDKLNDLTYLIESGQRLYLLYAQNLSRHKYAIVIGEIEDLESERFISFARESYNTILYDTLPGGPVGVLETINEYIIDGLDLKDPVELVLELGGISNNTVLQCPKR